MLEHLIYMDVGYIKFHMMYVLYAPWAECGPVGNRPIEGPAKLCSFTRVRMQAEGHLEEFQFSSVQLLLSQAANLCIESITCA